MTYPHTTTCVDRFAPADIADASAIPSVAPTPARVVLPDRYTDRYAYPLLVLFHPEGSNEETILSVLPQLSLQNFVVLSLRGPESVPSTNGNGQCFGWGNEVDHLAVQDYFLKAVEQTRRSFHIHSERIYIVGMNEGCMPAYRTALAMPDRIAGVVALNGPYPKPNGDPLFRLETIRGLKAFIGHGLLNNDTPMMVARHAQQVLWIAGAEVDFRTYMTNDRIHPDMLKDVNRWIVANLNAETDKLILKKKKVKKRKKF